MFQRLLTIGLLFCFLATATGCFLRGPSGVRREIAEATGARYDREFALTIGPVGMAIARWGVRIAEKHDEDGEMPEISLAGVRKVQVRVYQVEPGSWDEDHDNFDPAVLGDWEPVVRVQDDGEDVHVLLRTEDGVIRRMLVIVSEAEELVIVQMKGRLDEILEDALRYGLEQAESDEHYERALEQLEQLEQREAPAGA